MAWENRKSGDYFYQKLRVGKKVKSVYVGRGADAVLIDRIENLRRQRNESQKMREQPEKEKIESIDKQINSLSEFNRALVDALFLINGFHQHKRQWRKKRK